MNYGQMRRFLTGMGQYGGHNMFTNRMPQQQNNLTPWGWMTMAPRRQVGAPSMPPQTNNIKPRETWGW